MADNFDETSNNDDPFKKYGGQEINDPFSKFGGAEIKKKGSGNLNIGGDQQESTDSSTDTQSNSEVQLLSGGRNPYMTTPYSQTKLAVEDKVNEGRKKKELLDRDIDSHFDIVLNNKLLEQPLTAFQSGGALSANPSKTTTTDNIQFVQPEIASAKEKVKANPQALKEYAHTRLKVLDSQIQQTNNAAIESQKSFLGDRVQYNETPESIQLKEQSNQYSKYKNELRDAISNQAAITLTENALSKGEKLDPESIGRQVYEIIADPTLKDDNKVLAELAKPSTKTFLNPHGEAEEYKQMYDVKAAEKTKQNIEYQRYKTGSNAIRQYWENARLDLEEKFPDKISKLKELEAEGDKNNGLTPEQLVLANELLADDDIKSYLKSTDQINRWRDVSNNSVNQFPQVARMQERQKVNDAFFALNSAKDASGSTTAYLPIKLFFGSKAGKDDIDELSKLSGVSKEKVAAMIDEGGFFKDISSPVKISGLLGGIASGARDIIEKTGMGVRRFLNPESAVTETLNRIEADELSEINLRSQANKLRDDDAKWNINPFSIANTMGYGIGQTTLQAIPALLTGGLAAEGTLISRGLEAISTVVPGAAASYEDAYKTAANNTTDEPTRKAYAFLNSLANGAAELLYSPADIVKNIGKAVGKSSQEAMFKTFAADVTEKGLEKTVSSKLAQLGNKIWGVAKEPANVLLSENIEEFATNKATNALDENMLGIQRTQSQIADQTFETFIQTTLQTLPLAIGVGIGGNNDISGIRKQALFESGKEPELYKSRLKDLLDKEQITQDNYNQKVSHINTMETIVSKLPTTDAKGKPLTYEQSANLAAQQFRIENNKDKEKQGVLAAEEAIIEADNAEAIQEQTNILNPPEIQDSQIVPTMEEIKQITSDLSDEQVKLSETVEPIIERVNKADYINENQLNDASNVLYELWDKSPEARHLIEPLINKLENYEFATKTETSQVTEKVPVTISSKATEREIRPAIEQSVGSEASITTADGTRIDGQLSLKDGNYVITDNEGNDTIVGEKAITDRDLKLPSEEKMSEPIEFDENGNVKSVTFETKEGSLVSINNPDKALDLAIQLRAEAIGEINPDTFNTTYEEVQKEITKEVPIKNLSSQTKINQDESQNNQIGKSSLQETNNGEEGDQSSRKKGDGQEGDDVAQKEGVSELISETTPSSKKTKNENTQNTKQAAATVTNTKKTSDNSKETANIEEEDTIENSGRSFSRRLINDENITQEARKKIEDKLDYIVQTNSMSLAEANDFIDDFGLDESYDLVVNEPDIKPAVRVIMGERLILKYNELALKAKTDQERNAYIDKTAQIANYVSEKLGTEAGQMIQAFSLYSRLTPEGQLRDARKEAKKIGKTKKAKATSDVNIISSKIKQANVEAVNELNKSLEIKKTVQSVKEKSIVKAQEKVQKAKSKRADLIEKFKKGNGGITLTSGGLTPEGIEFIGSLAKTYFDEGIANIEIISQKILENIKSITGKSLPDDNVSQVRDIVNEKLANIDATLINKPLRELGENINEIVKKHYTVVDKIRTSLTDKLVSEAGLDQTDANELSKKIQESFDRIVTRKKEKILQDEKKRFDRIKKELEGSKKTTTKTLQDDIIKYSNLGAFDNDELLDMISEKLGTGQLTPDQANEIKRLADKVQNAPEGSPKNDATETLLKYRAEINGTSWGEIGQAIWYANVLSGYRTHLKNIVSTFFNGAAYVASESLKNPKAIPFIFTGGFKGLGRGAVEAWHTVTTGKSPIHISKVETPDVLERKKFIGGWYNPVNYLKFVGRLMKAEDVLQFQGLKESRAMQLAYSEAAKQGYSNPLSKATWDKVNETLLNTKDRYERVQEQIKEEGLKGIESKRRMYELMELSRPIQMTEDAYGFAAKGTFNHEPEGALGALTNAVSQALDFPVGGIKPFRFLVPFTRIITNVVNNSLDFSPIGLVRAARGVRGFKSFSEKSYGKSAYKKLSQEERHQLIAKASLGVALTAALYAISKIDCDEDKGHKMVEFTGGGTGNYKHDAQLRQSGWQPYSIRVCGGNYISYALTPLVLNLAWLGDLADREKYSSDFDQETWLQQFEMSVLKTIGLISEMTWIATTANLLNSFTATNADSIRGAVEKELSNTGKSFIIPNAYTQSAQEVQSIMNMPQKQVNNVWQSFIQDIPIARNLMNDKINALGEKIVRDTDILTSQETASPVWKFLLDKKGWVAPVNRASIVVFDSKSKKDRPVTDDEYYEFSKLRGEKIKEYLMDVMKNGALTYPDENGTIKVTTSQNDARGIKLASDLTPKEMTTLIRSMSTAASKWAKQKMFLDAIGGED